MYKKLESNFLNIQLISRGWGNVSNEVVIAVGWIRLSPGGVMEQRLILDIDRRLV